MEKESKQDLFYMIPYILLSIFHCLLCYKKIEPIRAITKCFLIPCLYISYLFSIKRNPDTTVSIIMFLHWTGDVFLLFKSKIRTIGMITFWLGDILYAFKLKQFLPPLKETYFIYVVSALLPIYVILMIGFKKILGNQILAFINIFFGAPLFTMVLLSVTKYLQTFNNVDFGLVVGSFAFIFSDYCVIRYYFKGDFEGGDLIIMSTYLAAEGFLISSIADNQIS